MKLQLHQQAISEVNSQESFISRIERQPQEYLSQDDNILLEQNTEKVKQKYQAETEPLKQKI